MKRVKKGWNDKKIKIKRTRRTGRAFLHATLSEVGGWARQLTVGPLQPPGAGTFARQLVTRVLGPRALALQGAVRPVVPVGAARLTTHTCSYLTLLTLTSLLRQTLCPKVCYAKPFCPNIMMLKEVFSLKWRVDKMHTPQIENAIVPLAPPDRWDSVERK